MIFTIIKYLVLALLFIVLLLSAYLIWCIKFPTYKVVGKSMYPVFKPGDCVFTLRKKFDKTNLKVGQVYVYKLPHDIKRKVVKRLVSIEENGDCFFIGDNLKDSYDSRHYGHVPLKHVVSKVIFKI